MNKLSDEDESLKVLNPREMEPKNLIDLSKLSIDLGDEDKSLLVLENLNNDEGEESKDPLLDNKMLILD